jgi:pantoate--beta-alanine ligase
MQATSEKIRTEGKKIVLVPTMGYLHNGHLSLIRQGKEHGDVAIMSLFVNPTQFAPNEDFEKYPRNFEKDCFSAEKSGCDILFAPEASEMYPSDYASFINIGGITKKFEGAFRPNHFKGVATVVAKLFNATKPHFAIFGQKDYQQSLVVKRLAEDLNFDLTIIVAPTVREADGLAMSSRNVYLSPEERSKATILFTAMEEAIEAIQAGERRRKVINAIMHNHLRKLPEIKIDYASAADASNFDEPEEFVQGQLIVLLLAVYLGKTRLIDNALVSLPSAISSKPKSFIDGLEHIERQSD